MVWGSFGTSHLGSVRNLPMPKRARRSSAGPVAADITELANEEDNGPAAEDALAIVTPPQKNQARHRAPRVPPQDIGISQLVLGAVNPVTDTVLMTVTGMGACTTAPRGLTSQALREACTFLSAADPSLAPLISLHGPPERLLAKGPGAFATLSKSICFQQLATQAAAKIFARVLGACRCTSAGILDHASVLSTTEDTLRSAGLSRAKAAYIRDLALHFHEGLLSDALIAELDADGLHSALTHVKGLGPWSVDMFAMFHLGLPDVLPVGDLGVRRGMQILYGLKDLPNAKQMAELAERWRPWRSVGSYYMWRVEKPTVRGASAKRRK